MIAVLNVLPLPNPPFIKATVYTQVIESPLFLKLPLPNPPLAKGLAKGRELILPVFPIYLQGG
ncbi:hypothetical protein OA07_26700 [Aphanizomenon flos-aquae 2012/KM1/D3]|nr:hypothetical protein OA07_26700 [Aphanizomenon flos-aquae 2012/KM1/D3]